MQGGREVGVKTSNSMQRSSDEHNSIVCSSFTISTDVVVNALHVTSGSFELHRVY